eukprot:scaffold160339_cov32-Tisochrysis_lutea.AAC.2
MAASDSSISPWLSGRARCSEADPPRQPSCTDRSTSKSAAPASSETGSGPVRLRNSLLASERAAYRGVARSSSSAWLTRSILALTSSFALSGRNRTGTSGAMYTASRLATAAGSERIARHSSSTALSEPTSSGASSEPKKARVAVSRPRPNVSFSKVG